MSSRSVVLLSLALVLAAGTSSSCQLDQLVTPEDPAGLAVEPAALADSAPAGSAAMRHRSISVSGDGTTSSSWHASVVGGSDWLQLSRTQDTVPSQLAVALKPSGLPAGTYADTILVAGDAGAAVRVPVRFVVQPSAPPTGSPRLVIATNPSAVSVGARIAPPLVVIAQDGAGRVSTSFSGAVTVVLGGNAAGATLAGTRSVSAVAGVVTFSDLTVDRAGTGYTLIASAAGFSSAETEAFNVTTGVPVSPSRSTLVVSPGSIIASNGSSSATITITARDATGNTLAGVPVVISVTGTGNTTTPGTGTTNGSGVLTATFSSSRTGSKVVGAAIGGVTIGATGTVIVTPAAATQLGFTVQPSDVDQNEAISPPVQVSALDAFGNVATSFAGNVTVAIASGKPDARLSGTLTRPVASGVAVFSNLAIDKDGGGYTLRTTAPGLTSGLSSTFKVNKS